MARGFTRSVWKRTWRSEPSSLARSILSRPLSVQYIVLRKWSMASPSGLIRPGNRTMAGLEHLQVWKGNLKQGDLLGLKSLKRKSWEALSCKQQVNRGTCSATSYSPLDWYTHWPDGTRHMQQQLWPPWVPTVSPFCWEPDFSAGSE